MQSLITIFLICSITTFIIMTDNQKVVSAKRLIKRANDDHAYTTKYDNIDIDKILASQRLLNNYIKCLLDNGPCTAEGKDLKQFLPDALATECSKCSKIQKKKAGQVFTHILQFHRDEWNQLLEKYDPDGNYRKKYELGDDADNFEYYDDEED